MPPSDTVSLVGPSAKAISTAVSSPTTAARLVPGAAQWVHWCGAFCPCSNDKHSSQRSYLVCRCVPQSVQLSAPKDLSVGDSDDAEALVLGLTYRGWNGLTGVDLPLPLIVLSVKPSLGQGYLAFPGCAALVAGDRGLPFWQCTIDGIRHAMTEYALNHKLYVRPRIARIYRLCAKCSRRRTDWLGFRVWFHAVTLAKYYVFWWANVLWPTTMV